MDLALSCEPFLYALAFEHTSGHLKVAPEHISPRVLELMRKPIKNDFKAFLLKHRALSKKRARSNTCCLTSLQLIRDAPLTI